MTQTHNYVQNYEQHEAVLLCKHEHPAYGKEAVIRAFQTYQFQDATTAADEDGLPFVHLETGAIVQYDGDALAINFGEEWIDMLPDLVLTLNALGWKNAEAYHPPETMTQFLQDLGRAIPAHIPFDAVPAKMGRKLSEFPEAQNLLAKARQVTGASATLLAEFEQLTTVAPLFDAKTVTATAPVHLVDDENGGLFDDVIHIHVRQQDVATQATRINTLDDEPPVVSLPAMKTQQWEEAETFAAKVSPTEARIPFAGTQAQENAIQPVPALHSTNRKVIPSSEAGGVEDYIELGNSLLLFDTPKHRLSPQDLEGIAGDFPVTHIQLGTLEPFMRWHVLGEIPDAQPWFAERLVSFMRLRTNCNTSLIAAMMLAVKQQNRFAQIRDVIDLALSDLDVQAQALVKVSKTAETMVKQSASTGALTRSVDALIHRIGGIALAPLGASILDIRTSEGALVEQCFTLRSLAAKKEKCAYVMHIDAQDGHFIDWICLFMRDIAKCIATSGSRSS